MTRFFRTFVLVLLAFAAAPVFAALTCTYHQKTGQLTCADPAATNVVDEKGYSGAGTDRNNPASECVKDRGPIPAGDYNIGAAMDDDDMGPVVLPLTPDPTQCTPPRSGFYIHGDKPGDDASHGCIIMSRATREKISNAGGGTVHVVAQ